MDPLDFHFKHPTQFKFIDQLDVIKLDLYVLS